MTTNRKMWEDRAYKAEVRIHELSKELRELPMPARTERAKKLEQRRNWNRNYMIALRKLQELDRSEQL